MCLAGLQSILITFASQLSVVPWFGSSFCRAQDSFTCYESRAEEESIAQLVSLDRALPPVIGLTLVRVFLSEQNRYCRGMLSCVTIACGKQLLADQFFHRHFRAWNSLGGKFRALPALSTSGKSKGGGKKLDELSVRNSFGALFR